MAEDAELARLIAELHEATNAKARVWERILHEPRDDALWEEYDAWRRDEENRHEALRAYLRSPKTKA